MVYCGFDCNDFRPKFEQCSPQELLIFVEDLLIEFIISGFLENKLDWICTVFSMALIIISLVGMFNF